jgi:hypothetical protein
MKANGLCTDEYPRILRKKADVLAFLQKHPTWVLEHCLGVGHSWYWLRPRTGAADATVKVDKRALPLQFFKAHFDGIREESTWRQSVYAFKP